MINIVTVFLVGVREDLSSIKPKIKKKLLKNNKEKNNLNPIYLDYHKKLLNLKLSLRKKLNLL